jgi:hypothetical protein
MRTRTPSSAVLPAKCSQFGQTACRFVSSTCHVATGKGSPGCPEPAGGSPGWDGEGRDFGLGRFKSGSGVPAHGDLEYSAHADLASGTHFRPTTVSFEHSRGLTPGSKISIPFRISKSQNSSRAAFLDALGDHLGPALQRAHVHKEVTGSFKRQRSVNYQSAVIFFWIRPVPSKAAIIAQDSAVPRPVRPPEITDDTGLPQTQIRMACCVPSRARISRPVILEYAFAE